MRINMCFVLLLFPCSSCLLLAFLYGSACFDPANVFDDAFVSTFLIVVIDTPFAILLRGFAFNLLCVFMKNGVMICMESQTVVLK